MIRLFSLILLSAIVFTVGCGSTESTTNIVEDADAQALEEYNAMIKADDEARKSWDK